ncbi:unnamed protein product [Callosobruchus maculatus]|uniref:Reverse transcriptase domain-containing protein n=1 Tax=Callosobruchus maculatus TaxID=64391 RepID=A0A653C9Z9_CALMS|nr:unnamed protein product [Callosobruchus maculatus]VEN46327.1 unnamed protein product [Callosobruchus maculatus]VEN54020.1 unnamed protein product [Callosobruchus maculatus]
MNFQIREHLDEFNVLPETQSGFRPGYSCTTALLTVTDDIITAIDRGKSSLLLLLDYSKAFDTLNHDLLISILHFVGFSKDAVKLMTSYLLGRMQYVSTDKGDSSRQTVSCGVPQGSTLGPLLFSIYTCYLPQCLKNCRVHLYADDTQLYFSFFPENKDNALTLINSDINNLLSYSNSHNLKINSKKSSILLFGKDKDNIQASIDIMVGNDKLQCVSSARNLGLIIDNNFRFNSHISKCVQKAYANLKMLYPHRHLLSQLLKIRLTDALVLSNFNYCDVIYNPCLEINTSDRIQKVQKSCLRFIYGIRKYDKVSHKLKDANWLNMKSRRILHSVVLFHNIISYRRPPYLAKKITFRTDVHNLNLRFRGKISPPPHRTSMFRRSYSYNIYYLYNQLPDYLKMLEPKTFKYSFKKYLINTQ